MTELAYGVSGTVLKSNGSTSAPSFQTDATGTGGVVEGSGAPAVGSLSDGDWYRDTVSGKMYAGTPTGYAVSPDWGFVSNIIYHTLTITQPTEATDCITCTDTDLETEINCCGSGGASEVCTSEVVENSALTGFEGTQATWTAWGGAISGAAYNDGAIANMTGPLTGYATFSAGITYLLEEDFEITGTPTGWDAGPNYDYQVSPLEGLESMLLAAGDNNPYTIDMTSESSDVYVAFPVRIDAFGSLQELLRVYDNTTTYMASIYISDTTVGIRATGQSTIFLGSSLSIATKYYFKLRYTAGSGADALTQGWYSTDGTTWLDIGISSDGSSTQDAAKLRFLDLAGSATIVIDDVRVSTSDINF